MSEYTGLYRGAVQDINDPDNRGRLRLLVPDVLGESASTWAEPMLPTSEEIFWAVGDKVWVQFEAGDLNRPVYFSRMAVESEDIRPGAVTPGTIGGNGAPPTDTTLPVIKPLGYAGVQISWDPIDNAHQFTKYKVRFDSVNPPVQEFSAPTAANIIATSVLPDGTALVSGTTYYAQIVATDPDGDGPPGGIASGGPVVVPASAVAEDVLVANEIFSRLGYFGAISAEQVETGQLLAALAIVGGLSVGPGVTIDPANGIIIQTPLGPTQFPTDGSAAIIKSDLVASSLTVLGNFAMRGTTNEIAKNSGLIIQSSTTAPKQGPSLTGNYPVHNLDLTSNNRGHVFFSTISGYLTTASGGGASLDELVVDGSGNYGYVQSWNLNSFGGAPEVTGAWGGVTVLGGEVYVLCTTSDYVSSHTGPYYIYQIHYDGGTGPGRYHIVRRWRYQPAGSLGDASDHFPRIATDGTNLFVVQCNSTGNWYVTTYSPTRPSPETNAYVSLDALRDTGGAQFNAFKTPGAFLVTAGDYSHGLTRWILGFLGAESHFYVFSTSAGTVGNRAPSDEWDSPNNQIFGMLYDGTRFKMRSFNNDEQFPRGYVYDFSQIKDNDLASNPVNAVQTWRNRDASDTFTATVGDFAKYETLPSPRTQNTTLKKRAWLSIQSSADIPDDPGDANDADSLTFYIARGTGTPTNASYKRVVPPAAGVQSQLLDLLPTSGGAPPTVSTFGASTPGYIYSAVTDADGAMIRLIGDGSGRVGPFKWGTSANVPRMIGGFDFGNTAITATSVVSASVTVSHGLGVTPTTVGATLVTSSVLWFVLCSAKTSTQLTFTITRKDGAAGSLSPTIDWQAWV